MLILTRELDMEGYSSKYMSDEETLMKLYDLRSDIEYQKSKQTLQGTNIDELYKWRNFPI